MYYVNALFYLFQGIYISRIFRNFVAFFIFHLIIDISFQSTDPFRDPPPAYFPPNARVVFTGETSTQVTGESPPPYEP